MKLSNRIRATALLVVTLALGVAATGTATAATKPKETKEVKLISSVRPTIDEMAAAIKKGDIVGARNAYEAYNAAWNGVEVYTNFRSLPTYQALEIDIEAKISSGLSATSPNLTTLATLVQQLGAKYDEVITLSKNGAKISPLFDDVADLRVVRASLRIVTAALNAGDPTKAQEHFTTFKKDYPGVRALVKARSTTADGEITAAITGADAAFKQPSTTVNDLKTLVAAITARYNFSVNLINAAARNADIAKTAFTDGDTKNLTSLNDVVVNLDKSLTAWKASNFAASGQAAAAANTAFAAVQPALAAKNADASLRTTLAAYTALAGTAGNATSVTANNQAAKDAALVAEQVVVGQFWADAKLQSVVKGLPNT